MHTEEMIPAEEFCIHHNIELSFINSLHDSGLIEVLITEEKIYLPLGQLKHLEKMARLYYEMDINLEGIETINYLMEKMNVLQQEIRQLTNRLGIYEEER